MRNNKTIRQSFENSLYAFLFKMCVWNFWMSIHLVRFQKQLTWLEKKQEHEQWMLRGFLVSSKFAIYSPIFWEFVNFIPFKYHLKTKEMTDMHAFYIFRWNGSALRNIVEILFLIFIGLIYLTSGTSQLSMPPLVGQLHSISLLLKIWIVRKLFICLSFISASAL